MSWYQTKQQMCELLDTLRMRLDESTFAFNNYEEAEIQGCERGVDPINEVFKQLISTKASPTE